MGDGVEFAWSSGSTVFNVVVALAPKSEARVFKTTGSTDNTFKNLTLTGGQVRTGLSFSSGTSYNKIYNLVSTKSASCVWLNGTGNNYNYFDGVITNDCNIRATTSIKPRIGYSISVGRTAPYVDVGNTFINVDGRSRPYVAVINASNTISYRPPP
jgi:hypothetical protein